MKRFLPYAATALGSVVLYLCYSFGPVHAAGLRHTPGACEPCDVATAQLTVNLVQRAQAAAVGSAQ